ncbi:hypothetical protein AAFF_G00417680 [Aldrovandia affinis]|uniref:von Hippel-Lindau disease tumor suppressor n=1 Tax=Aldrovandia affinis TaxID=143900 RepID=A0AAD7SAB3_9TELE|nr:hypothetical protein AAFF_G00417680 [Aldrovandia affinis]
MAEQEVSASLKSQNADIPTYVIFINNSTQDARAWWLNYSGNPVSYGDIRRGTTLKMNTFLGHPWLFRSSENGAKLLANMQEVYLPVPTEYEDGHPIYMTVMITAPVYSLQECCSMLIRKLVRKEDYDKLHIPRSLINDLAKAPNLQKEIKNLNAAFRETN